MNIVWKGLDCCSVLVALWVSFSLSIYLLFANAAKTAGGGGVHSSTQRGSGVPLCLAEAPLEFAAADAWADENSAGIGGWWWPSGCAATPSSARWFSIQFERADCRSSHLVLFFRVIILASLHIRIRSTGPIGVALLALPIL